MAKADVYLNLDALASDVIALNTRTISNIDTQMSAVCNTVAALTLTGWDGSQKDKFMTDFNTFKTDMRKFYVNLQDFNTCLGQLHEEGERVFDKSKEIGMVL